jgi:hypothetical protein
MATVLVRIVDGEAVVTADGSKTSCAASHDVEKALGQVTKSVPTGKACEVTQVQTAR